MEKRSDMGGYSQGYHLLFARDSGHGVPDPGKFNKRGSDNRMSEPDRSTRNRGGSLFNNRSGFGSTTAGLPDWYYIGVTILATALIILFVVLM